MQAATVRFPLVAFVLLAGLTLAAGLSRALGAGPLPIADGQMFVVRLTTQTPTGPATPGIPACNVDIRHRIEQIPFEFVFSLQGDMLSVVISTPDVANGSFSTPLTGTPPAIKDLYVQAEPFLALYLSATFAATAGANGNATALTLPAVTAEVQVLAGDTSAACNLVATGAGVPDTTAPVVTFALRCSGASGQPSPCLLLPESAITLNFSKPVHAAQLPALLSAEDGQGNAVALYIPPAESPTLTSLDVFGFWSLGGQVTLTVAPGLGDQAGNVTAQPLSQRFQVVDDPGAFVDGGFESGTLTGYTVTTLREYTDHGDEALYLASSVQDQSRAINVVPSLRGIRPTEGQQMAAIDNSLDCSVGEVALVAHLSVPSGATALLLDVNLLQAIGPEPDTLAIQANPPVSATVRGAGEFRTVVQPRPTGAALASLDDTYTGTGWQSVSVPVDGLGGQDVLLTLRLRPSVVMAPPPLCIPGTLLLDNLRFE